MACAPSAVAEWKALPPRQSKALIVVEGPEQDDVPLATQPREGATVGFVGFDQGTEEGVNEGCVVGTSVGACDSKTSLR